MSVLGGGLALGVVSLVCCFGGTRLIQDEMLTANRVLHIGSGVSPFLTILMLGGLFLYWCLFRLDYLASCRQLPGPSGEFKKRADDVWRGGDSGQAPWVFSLRQTGRQFDALSWAEHYSPLARFFEPAGELSPTFYGRWRSRLARVIGMPILPIALLVTIVLALVITIGLFGLPSPWPIPWSWPGRFTPTAEGPYFDLCIVLAILVYLVIYLRSFGRMIGIWRSLRPLLITLDSLPWGTALDRLPAKVSRLFGRFMNSKSDGISPDGKGNLGHVIKVQYARAVARDLLTGGGAAGLGETSPVVRHLFTMGRACPSISDATKNLITSSRSFLGCGNTIVDAPDELMWACLPFVAREWDLREPRAVFGAAVASGGRASAGAARSNDRPVAESIDPRDTVAERSRRDRGGVATETERAVRTTVRVPATAAEDAHVASQWLALAEDYVLISLVLQLRRFAPPLRKLAAFLMTSPVLLLLAIVVYPFQPQHMLTMLIWILVLGAVALCTWIFVQIDRDPFVSRISNTTPNCAQPRCFVYFQPDAPARSGRGADLDPRPRCVVFPAEHSRASCKGDKIMAVEAQGKKGPGTSVPPSPRLRLRPGPGDPAGDGADQPGGLACALGRGPLGRAGRRVPGGH